MGGNLTREKDRTENLMAQTREEHLTLVDKVSTKAYEYQKHLDFLEKHGEPFDKEYILTQIDKFACLNEGKNRGVYDTSILLIL